MIYLLLVFFIVIVILIFVKFSKNNSNEGIVYKEKSTPIEKSEKKDIEEKSEKQKSFKITYIKFPEGYIEKIDESSLKSIDNISSKLLNSSFNIALDKQLLLAKENDDTTPKEFNKIISADPVLSAKVLQIVNSAYFGFKGEITSTFRAIVLMGSTNVKSILTQYLIRKKLLDLNENQQNNFLYMWKFSTITSAVARYLSMIKFHKIDNDLGTIALIHNIGKYYMFLIDESYDLSATPDIYIEDNKYGFNHANLGANICNKLKLPQIISETIKYHHYPAFKEIEKVPENIRFNVATIYLSNMITEIFIKEGDIKLYPMKDEYYKFLGIDNDIEKLITSALITEINKAKEIINRFQI
jgi:HD-like signal output (HDOD) protein